MKKSDSFYNLETLGGILLFFAAVLAIIVANSPLRIYYEQFLNISSSVSVGSLSIKKPLLLWINDGLMALYFLLIGLEIKRETKRGIFVPLAFFYKFKHLKGSLTQTYGLALVCGVGFTMSFFIGSLAYQNEDISLLALVKIGVIFGSFISGLFGFLVLYRACSSKIRNQSW